MAASSNKTDEDISNILDKADESDVLSEESDGFFYLIQGRKIQTVSRIQAMKVNRMKNCHIFRIPLYLTAWRIQDLHLSV